MKTNANHFHREFSFSEFVEFVEFVDVALSTRVLYEDREMFEEQVEIHLNKSELEIERVR